MLALTSSKIFIYTEPVDMRSGFDALALLVAEGLKRDSFSGEYFVFFSRSKRLMKILRWEKDGYGIYYKRLEQGSFDISKAIEKRKGASIEIDQIHFTMLMAGIDFSVAKKQKRYERPMLSDDEKTYRVADSEGYVSSLNR